MWYLVEVLLAERCFDKHDDVMKWKHFPRNWPFVREIHRSPDNSSHKGQWRGVLMFSLIYACMGLLPDTWNCGLRMRRECRERFPCGRLQRKPLASDPGMHQGTCVTHVPWCMSGSLTGGGGENVPGIPDACEPVILCIWQEAHRVNSLFEIKLCVCFFCFVAWIIG